MIRIVVCGMGWALLSCGSLAAAIREKPRLPSLGELPPLPGRFSVEEAYQAIPHRRTVFLFEQSPIPAAERSYLRLMFDLIDRGIVLRVSAYQSFYYGGPDKKELLDGIALLARFIEAEVTPPEGLEVYHGYVVSALKDQNAFFSEWLCEGADFSFRQPNRLGQHHLIQKSSRALRGAYGVLMTRYGARESRQNQNAFFDYHCALDFL